MRCLTALLFTSLALMSLPAAAQAKRTVTGPAEVVVGQTFKITTSGWKRSERLRLYYGQPNTDNTGVIKAKRASRSGRATFAVRLTAPTMVGRMMLQIVDGKTGSRRANLRVNVHGTAPALQHLLSVQDGVAGPLTLDRSTEQDILAALGKPHRRTQNDTAVGLTYRCGRMCETVLWLNVQKGAVLSDIVTTSTGWRTPAGTTAWMSQVDASRREKDAFTDGCINSLTVEGDTATITLESDGGMVSRVYFSSRASSIITC